MQPSMSHAGGFSRNSAGDKKKEKAQGKGLCVMEMCITGYCVMDNAIHSTWKS